MMHIHKWSAWQDVKVAEKVQPSEHTPLMCVVREVIVQQRRCSVCNLVKTRHS
jgi:hypothetical protein